MDPNTALQPEVEVVAKLCAPVPQRKQEVSSRPVLTATVGQKRVDHLEKPENTRYRLKTQFRSEVSR